MASYVIGCYIDDQLVAHVPHGGGEVTPDAVGPLNPFRCSDSWDIVPL
jgi:hypothetical protein